MFYQKKFLVLKIILGLGILAGVKNAFAEEEEGIVKNPGFESITSAGNPTSWLCSKTSLITIDSDGPYEGKCCIKVEPGGETCYIEQSDISLQQESVYVVSAWVKAEADKNSELYQKTKERRLVGLSVTTPDRKVRGSTYIAGSPDWRPVKMYLYTQDRTDFKLNLEFWGHVGLIKALVDKVSIKKISEEEYGGNLIPDGGFEKCLADEFPTNIDPIYDAGEVLDRLIVDDKVVHSGKNSMRIHVKEGESLSGCFGWEQIPIKMGDDYRLRLWMKSKNKTLPVKVCIDTWTAGIKHFFSYQAFDVTPEWKEYTLMVTIPAKEDKEYGGYRLKAQVNFNFGESPLTDTIWIDDVSLENMDL